MVERNSSQELLDLGKTITLFIGPEGSGKTTQAKRLAQETGKPYITTGDIIRDLAANDQGPLGDECREMFANKAYLAGPTLLKILIDRFSKDDTKDGFVLDGGLRTIEETIDFRKMLKEAGRDLPLIAVYLKITMGKSYERLLNGPNARKRKDDTFEAITSRLEKFHFRLNDRLDVIKSEKGWMLIELDASPDEEQVYGSIVDSLKTASQVLY